MRRQQIAVYLALMATTSSFLAAQARPKDTPSSTAKSAKPEAAKSAALESKSLTTPSDDANASPVIVAKAPNIDVSKPYGYHLEPILQKINASADQRGKIVQIVQSYKSKIQPLRDEYKGKRQEFISIMTGGGAAESIMAKQMELSHLASEITSKYTLMRLEIRRLLSPQQILQFEDYARQHGWNSH